MSKAIPHVQKYMTTTPHSIGYDQTLRTASEIMEANRIRHLPVLHGGKLVGVLSDRDLKMAMGIVGVDADKTTVEDIASEEVYLTSPDAPIDEVARQMSERRLGSALVVDNHKLVGIFTTTDALRALDDLLHTRLKG